MAPEQSPIRKDNGGSMPTPKPMSAGEMLEHLHQDILQGHGLIRYNTRIVNFICIWVGINHVLLWLYLLLS